MHFKGQQVVISYPMTSSKVPASLMTGDHRFVTIEYETMQCEMGGHSVIYLNETNSLHFVTILAD
jgi:hypothetical protein